MIRTRSRRESLQQLVAAIGFFLLLFLNRSPASAGEDPCCSLSGKSLTWIVPHAPGGGYDTYCRLIEPYLEHALSAHIIVKNYPGAGGLVGAQYILNAAPDGRTIGIINGAGLLAASIAGQENAPNPSEDFTILCRIARSRHVWATGKDSPFRTIEDVFAAGRERPIVFGTRDVGSLSFFNMSLTSHLLGLNIEIVPGYLSSSAGVLAAIRGEVDLVAYNFDSIRSHFERGDIRPLLQIADDRISSHPALDDVALLGGPDGVAVGRANLNRRDTTTVLSDITTLVEFIGAGRLIVAPPGMNGELSDCLEKHLTTILTDLEFQKMAGKAKLTLDIAAGDETRRQLLTVSKDLEQFLPVMKETIRKVRQ
jgi:tripartite-type tricarboxylate transporter receptor subunit TctC